MITEFSNWHTKWKSFTLLQGVTFCGNLEFWASTRPWARFLYLALRSLVNDCLRNCSQITNNKRDIKIIIEAVAQCTDTLSLQARFLQGKITQEIYNFTAKTRINKKMRSELQIITTVLSHPLKYNLKTPTIDIVPRDLDFITYGDACSEAADGFSEGLKFWWHVEFPDSIKSKTLKNINITRKCALF